MKTIASVYYKELKADRPYRAIPDGSGWNYHFHIEAVPRGEVRTLKVPSFKENVYFAFGQTIEKTDATTDELVAADLVQFWSDGGYPDLPGGPGVCVCTGSEPTKAEIAAILQRQTAYANGLVNNAQNKWIAGQRDKVNQEERDAAMWLGKMDFEWIKPAEAVSLQACPHCGQQIETGVMKCRYCQSVVNFEKYAVYIQQQRAAEAKFNAAANTAPVAVMEAAPNYDGNSLDLTADAPIPAPKIPIPQQHRARG